MDSKSITPFYADKALWLVVLSSLLPPISKKLGIQLDPSAVYGFFGAVITYVVAHKAKSWAILKQELAQEALSAGKKLVEKELGPPTGNPATKALVGVLAVGALLGAAPARAAAPVIHVGPSVSLYEARLSGQIGQLTPGLGFQAWITTPLQTWHLGATVFGSALGLGTAHPGAALSVAPYACFNPIGLCAGPGIDFAQLDGGASGLLQGFTWKKNFFLVATVLPKFWELLHIHG